MEVQERGEDVREFRGSETFLVGIAPNYWAHVPMTVADIQHLVLKDGIHCWVSDKHHIHVPVCRCLLVGTIVCLSIRSYDEALTFVLDDGTGFVDCLFWTRNTVYDTFQLPSLQKKRERAFRIGDRVRLFATIQGFDFQPRTQDGTVGKFRELMVTRMHRLTSSAPNQEAEHWSRCVKHQQSLLQDPTKWNALSYLKRLGPVVESQVRNLDGMPSADDTLAEWRVFGLSCTCNMAYKHELLYCHCQAQPDSLDPQFVFRDAVLNWLLGQQAKHPKRWVFHYKTVKSNVELRSLAQETLSNTDNSKRCTVDTLFWKTFGVLRRDKVLILIDPDADKYILVTCQWVLEPHIRNQEAIRKEVSKENASMAKAVRNAVRGIRDVVAEVPKERREYVRRCYFQKQSGKHTSGGVSANDK